MTATRGRRPGPSLGSSILARIEASDRARRRIVSVDDSAFESDFGFANFGADVTGPGGRPVGSPHVRSLGAYAQNEAITEENQYPDRFGQYMPAFGYDGMAGESAHGKTVADLKKLVSVVEYRVKAIRGPVYAVPDTCRDREPLRADYIRLHTRVMAAFKKAQHTIVACSGRVSVKDCDAPAEEAYEALVRAMRQGGTGAAVQKGDYDDIVTRVERCGGKVDLSLAPEFGYEPPSFGDNIAGEKSIADLKDLLANWDAGMSSLGNSFAQFAPQWVQSNPTAMADWSNDWAALQDRYGRARADAQSAIDAQSSTLRSVLTLGASSLVGDQAGASAQYLEVLKAIKQATTDVNGGASVTKGDYDDLAQRLTVAQKSASAPIFKQQVVQPVAPDPGLTVLKSTQNVDVIGGLTGQFHSPVLNAVGSAFGINTGQPGGPPKEGVFKAVVIVGTLALGGVFAYRLFIAPTIKASLGFVGTLLGGYIGYKSIGFVATEASKLGSSPGAKLLGL